MAGILEILLGFWASQQMFPARAALLLVWVGFFALFRGISEIQRRNSWATVRQASSEPSRPHNPGRGLARPFPPDPLGLGHIARTEVPRRRRIGGKPLTCSPAVPRTVLGPAATGR